MTNPTTLCEFQFQMMPGVNVAAGNFLMFQIIVFGSSFSANHAMIC